ncbi:hypothetical protein EVAR_21099_1 [Eumeta japonica]|uniref:Uncharacterized protein n=1 Tax=Eumeta variegata TaxID=151549 RepID=A0A4C1V020_EUMVA|nr:hypothetical protein EVAR_21099_1 [Eumeta japonica]
MRQYQASHTSDTLSFGLRRLRLELWAGRVEVFFGTKYKTQNGTPHASYKPRRPTELFTCRRRSVKGAGEAWAAGRVRLASGSAFASSPRSRVTGLRYRGAVSTYV